MQRIPKPEPPKKQGNQQKGASHEKMVDIEDNLALPNLKIIGIKVFTGNDGMLYWVAVAAEDKVKP